MGGDDGRDTNTSVSRVGRFLVCECVCLCVRVCVEEGEFVRVCEQTCTLNFRLSYRRSHLLTVRM